MKQDDSREKDEYLLPSVSNAKGLKLERESIKEPQSVRRRRNKQKGIHI